MLWLTGALTTKEGLRLGIVVIGLLLAAWAVLLVPSLQMGGRRQQASPFSGVRRFESTMGILANTRTTQVPGRWVMVPKDMNSGPQRRRNRLVRKRRQTFQRLLFAVGATLLIGLLPRLHSLLLVHLALDVAFAVYIVRLRKWAQEERQRPHRTLPPPDRPDVSEPLTIESLQNVDLGDEEEGPVAHRSYAVSQ